MPRASVIPILAVMLSATVAAPEAAALPGDPIVQQAYLKASSVGPDGFGGWVALSGDTLVVGAVGEDSSATGVDGDQGDNSLREAGAAYVFVRDGGSWSQQAYLKASNPGSGDEFGWPVAISGDTIVIGSYLEASSSTGVDGDQDDESAISAGAAYVFVRNGTTWSQQAYLKASNTEASDDFAYSVAVSGDTIVIGAPGESSASTGVNGDQADNSASEAGAAYVFVRKGTSWSQQAYLKASNSGVFDQFGTSVSISGDTVLVGAYGESSSATGVGGNQGDDSAPGAGAAYVFVRDEASWSQEAYLKASNAAADDWFGERVCVAGDTAVVVAYREDSHATGVNGNQASNSAPNSGAAYVFARSGTSWTQQAYLKASNTAAGDEFGRSVSVSGDLVIVAASREDSSATGVGGNQLDNGALDSGAAYVFRRTGTSWSQHAYLKASNTGPIDMLYPTSVSGDTVLLGAAGEDSGATGVNGDQGDNSVVNAGAAYVLDLGPAWTDLDSGLAGTSGVPLLVGTGSLAPGSSNQLALSGAQPLSPATLVVGLSSLGAPFKGGTLVPLPTLLVPVATSAAGGVSLSFTWPAGIGAGLALYLQFWISDPGAPLGLSASNALAGLSS